MADDRKISFYHSPNTRSFGVRVLLEELQAPYDLAAVNMKAGEQRQAPYLAINPLGKVPAIRHGEALITEQVAIMLYLADLFPKAGLAPAFDDPLRGPYLRWMIFYAASFEPAVVDFALKREQGPLAMSPYGDYETVLKALAGQLARGPWLLGDRFTAADVLWGTALSWTVGFKIVPELPEIMSYLDRFKTRPAIERAKAADALLAREHEALAEKATA